MFKWYNMNNTRPTHGSCIIALFSSPASTSPPFNLGVFKVKVERNIKGTRTHYEFISPNDENVDVSYSDIRFWVDVKDVVPEHLLEQTLLIKD